MVRITCNALALCLAIQTTSGYSAELLTNPGFEGAHEATAPDWSVNSWGEVPPEFRASRETTDVREGAAAQRLSVTNLPPESGVLLRHEFNFKQGRVYRGSLWLRSSDGAKVQVLMRRAGPHYDAGAVKAVQLDSEWREVCITGGFGDGEVAGLLGVHFMEPGTIVVDQASMVDITDSVLRHPTSSEPIPPSMFGIHINKLGTHNVWPDLGAGLLRLWDTGTRWRDLQPEPDRWEWTRADYYVRHVALNAPQAQILMTLGMTPDWASSPGGKEGGGTNPPLRMDAWRNYIRAVGQRYRGQIRYWEIWNESNYSGFYTGSIPRMLEMARIAWEELKAIDPANVVLSPNITTVGLPWLDEYLAQGGAEFADIISYHCYQPERPEDAVPNYAAVRDLLLSHRVETRPVWNTEGAIELKTALSESDAAGAVARTYLVQWAQGIGNFSWYGWDIHWSGNANLSETMTGDQLAPGGVAYRTLASWLTGARMTRRTVDGDAWTVELISAKGATALIAWTTRGEARIQLPEGWASCVREELLGGSTTIRERTVTVRPAPALFHQGQWR